jgi:hypothetical protein
MIRTEEGLLVFARRPCRTGCSHAEEAFTDEELAAEVAARERRMGGPNRALLPSEEAEVRRSFRPGNRELGIRSNAGALADRFRVTTRTIYRTVRRANGRALCPGADGRGCLVETPGGRLCGFCRRSSS